MVIKLFQHSQAFQLVMLELLRCVFWNSLAISFEDHGLGLLVAAGESGANYHQ